MTEQNKRFMQLFGSVFGVLFIVFLLVKVALETQPPMPVPEPEPTTGYQFHIHHAGLSVHPYCASYDLRGNQAICYNSAKEMRALYRLSQNTLFHIINLDVENAKQPALITQSNEP